LQKGDELMASKGTATELFIPKLGQTVEEVTIVDWLIEDGVKIEFGQPVLEVETDKAIFPIEANASGYLHRGSYQPGETVPVLTVVATIGKQDEPFSIKGAAPEAQPQAAPREVIPDNGQTKISQPSEIQEGRIFISPRAQKLAKEKRVDISRITPSGGGGVRIAERDVVAFLSKMPKATPVALNIAVQAGLDLSSLSGTGTDGVITKADVESALRQQAQPVPEPAAVTAPSQVSAEAEIAQTVPLKGIRQIIFDRMAASVHTTARVTLVTEADATDFVQAREKLKAGVAEAWGFSPGYNDLLAVIVARALREFPYMNARVSADGSAIEWLSRVNLGMAVDTERGLLVPVIRDADKKGLREFGLDFRDKVERARAGRALPDDLSGGSFTITNLGMYEVDAFTPVINLPEAAILGVGRIHEKPVAIQGQVVVRQMWSLSLVFDHRLVDGAPAARFLQRIKQMIENPFLLLG
jgi:pyruvate dehydrogenase E2 component (dihydrolipoamide acetyltransferase)